MSGKIFAFRTSLLFLLLFFGMGIQLPFLPLWLKDQGFSETGIAMLLAAQIAIRVISAPTGAFLADRFQNRRAIIQWGAACAGACYVALCLAGGFWPIVIAVLLAGMFFSMIVPLSESFSIEGATHFGLDYGKLRLWGTVSFMAGNVLGGVLLEYVAVHNVIFMIAAAQLLLVVATRYLPVDPVAQRVQGEGPRLRVRDALRLFSSPAFLAFLAAISLGQASHALYYSLGSVHWQHEGYSEATIGLLWLTGGVAEVLVFGLLGKAARTAGPLLVMTIGIAGGVVRWSVTALDPPLAILFLAQVLHACSFSLTHLGTMNFIQARVAPQLRNTAQGLYAALSGGLAMSVLTLSSGALYRDFGGHAYFAMAGVSAMGLGFALVLFRLNPKGLLGQGAS